MKRPRRVMTRLRVLPAVATVMLIISMAPRGWALCPNCLGQTRAVTPTLELIGAFLLLPFIVACVVIRRIRRACRDLE